MQKKKKKTFIQILCNTKNYAISYMNFKHLYSFEFLENVKIHIEIESFFSWFWNNFPNKISSLSWLKADHITIKSSNERNSFLNLKLKKCIKEVQLKKTVLNNISDTSQVNKSIWIRDRKENHVDGSFHSANDWVASSFISNEVN